MSTHPCGLVLVDINCVFALALVINMLTVDCLTFFSPASAAELFLADAITVFGAIIEFLLA